jgi:hypothetical protein
MEPDMSAEKDTAPASRTRYGTANPEKMESNVWTRAIRDGWGGYALRRHYETKGGTGGSEEAVCGSYADSSYRQSVPGPYWSWDRFGRTSTKLPDGRIVHVAGEHEDYYDYDFCIYNDVIVEHPDGRLEFHLYPRDVFPPTDFHTATLMGEDILLIGSLGYRDLRHLGETQVLRLDTHTFRIEPVETSGSGPGWISRHRTEWIEDTRLLVLGGNVETAEGYGPNEKLFALDLSVMRWQSVAHADPAIFPIAEDVYHANKAPRYGTANPERSSNPFWREMLSRNWTPSRARLHYGDAAGSEAGDDTVWTAIRQEPLEITVPDGRHFLIGGVIDDYGDESADAWTYNDVIVRHPGGQSEILTYPLEALPDLRALAGFHSGDAIYIFGVANWKRDKSLPRGPHIYRLDLASYEVSPVTSAPSHLRVNPSTVRFSEDGTKAVMQLVRQTRNDPKLCVDLDLQDLVWSAPYPSAE